MNLKQITTANHKDFTKARNQVKCALDCYINIGERLVVAKNLVDDFKDWLENSATDFDYPQATKYIRVATHKELARKLLLENGGLSINQLQPLLPKTAATPEETEADTNNMAYVGAKPGAARNSDDWHTPKEFTDAASNVMGSIDLDPFTSEQANVTIGATRVLTEADNALDMSWASAKTKTVWMNPPYSKGNSAKAVDKFLEEYDYGSFDQAVVLMNSSTDTNWFHRLVNVATAVCFTKGRISFEDAGGKKSSGNTKGQVFFYFGRKAKTFKKVFDEYGVVMMTSNVL